MDSFLQDIVHKLQEESMSLSSSLEPEFKQMSVKTFTCMADCFKSPESISSCSDCADKCNTSISNAQQEIEKHVVHVQNSFQNCMQGCNLKINTDNEVNKKCITACFDEAIVKFTDVKALSKDIMRKYL